MTFASRNALLLATAALGGCKQPETAPVVVPIPIVLPATAATPAPSMLGPFDPAAASFDLHALFPDATVEGPDTSNEVTVKRGGKMLAYVELFRQTAGIRNVVTYQHLLFAEFAKAHPDARCAEDNAIMMCWPAAAPDIKFWVNDYTIDAADKETPIANVTGSDIDVVEWEPPTPRTLTGITPTRFTPDVIGRCTRVLASTNACGYFYDPEFGFSKDAARASVKAPINLYDECDVEFDESDGSPLPVPEFSEETVVAIEAARAKGCNNLRAELEKYTLVNENGPI
jgi:hypothetical protein